ncbi:virulence-associated E family protein [Qipengyuania oceanensis]|uniref:Virulence-associated protein E-like domain-containing protein n=1 Tax=Qipengyuania oceanensis TaxID=1463597 RepID=A0A844YF13_9SPHN|nr:virulence-associated E family protein [Qipengyuania oceanensis]MXO62522.1 hypothetical protein [Qipengyuania oceanensis]
MTAIPPDGGPTHTKTVAPGEAEEALGWFEEHSAAERNLYWTVNPTRERITSKAKKTDIENLDWLHVDIDPADGADAAEARKAALALLGRYKHKPTLTLDSGGGIQAFFRLEEPGLYIGCNEDAAEEAECYTRQIEADLSRMIEDDLKRQREEDPEARPLIKVDGTHDCCRLMRLPGTVNWPNKKKRDDGRKPRLATVLEYDDKRVYPLGEFTAAPRKDAAPTTGQAKVQLDRVPPPLANLDELPAKVTPRIRMLIVQGDDPDEPDRYKSRSEATFAVCRGMVEGGCDNETIAAVLLDPGFGISAHTLAQKRSLEYAARQIERARKEAAASADTFATDKDGKVYANHQGNIRLALRKLGVELRHDTFADRSVIDGLDGHGPHLDDAALTRLWLEIDERFRFRPQIEFFTKVIMDTARNAPFHPVCDELDSLEWDGTPRLDRWLSTYGGAEDNEYTRAVGALPLIAAVRRVRQPGCKFDEMLILESEQGTNKSSALRVLAGRDEQFADDLPLNADGKKTIEQTAGKWIIEAGELKGMRKGEVEHLKAFLSRQDDTARLSYARLPVIVPRQFVVIGTTNSERYLRDLTGNRRFWPVRVGCFDLEALRRDRDQIWAEAAAREAEGASIRLDPSLYAAAGVEQEARKVEDPHVETLAAALGDRTGKLRAADVWNLLGMPPSQRTQDQNGRVGDAMRELGWERTKLRFGGKPVGAYAKGSKRQRERSLEVSLGAAGYFVDDAASPELDDGDDELPY